jgi:pre-rRNA-processing protein TSR3
MLENVRGLQIFVLMLRQDDPYKCTAARLARFGLAKALYHVRQIPQDALVLNPMAERIILSCDSQKYPKLIAIDCSWEKVQREFARGLPGQARRLPTLLAANPTNYAKRHKLSSAEALAAASFIMGFRETANKLLSKFKWGETFLTLNNELLEAYSEATSEEAYAAIEAQFF